MRYNDKQVLDALEDSINRDKRISEDIQKAIASHDKDFFGKVVIHVLNQLHRTVSDLRRFINEAYELFQGR